MQTKVGVEFEIDFAHTLKGHPKCGKPHGHTAKIIVEATGELKNEPRSFFATIQIFFIIGPHFLQA